MKTLLIIMSILTIAAVSYAKDVFKDEDMKDLQVVAIQDGKAVIQDKHGEKAEIRVGDHIGRGKVAEIEKNYITVGTETGRSRIPVTHGFERR